MGSAYRHQIMAATASGLGMANCMYLMNFPAFGVPSMEKDDSFDITPDQAILVGSLVPLLGIVGNVIGGVLVDVAGRKRTIFLGYFVQLAGCAALALSTTAQHALVARAVTGVACSVIQIPSMIYFGEVTHPATRDRFGCIIGILATLGSMVPYMLGSSVQWRATAWLGAASLLPAMGLLSLMPQTPVYLIKKGKIQEAKKSLNWFRQSSTEAAKEFKEIEKSIRDSETSSMNPKLMFKAPYRTVVLVNICLLATQQLTGITAIMTYMSQIAEYFGIEWSSYISSGLTVINLVATILASEINSRFNRRPVILLGTSVCIGLQGFLTYLFWGKASSSPQVGELLTTYPNLPLVVLFAFLAVFGLSVGPIPFVYIGESFPTKIKGPASGLSFTINTLLIGYILQSFRPAVDSYGYHGTFLAFAIVCVTVFAASFPYMLETRGKSVSDIDDFYNKLEKKQKQS